MSGFYVIVFLFVTLQSFAKTNRDNIHKRPQSNYSSITPFNLVGDANLCLVVGVVLGTYRAGGEVGDVYHWTVTNSEGDIIDRKRAGGLETYKFLFREEGQYKVNLIVSRGTINNFYTSTLPVTIQKGPKLALLPDYLLCGSEPVKLYALDLDTPDLNTYTITWSDNLENVLATGNEFIAQYAGEYNVSIQSSSCEIKGSTYVGRALDFKIETSTDQLCEGNSANIKTDIPRAGEWFIQKEDSNVRKSFGKAFQFSLNYNDLPSAGKYFIIFIVNDPNYPECPSERISSIELLEAPNITITDLFKPDDLNSNNGKFNIEVNSDLESLSIKEIDFNETNITAGAIFKIKNLEPRVYTIESVLNGCKTTKIIPLGPTYSSINSNDLYLTSTDESCSTNGVDKGIVTLTFDRIVSEGIYKVFSKQIGLLRQVSFTNSDNQDFMLSAGKYIIEVSADGEIYPFQEVTIAKQKEVSFSIPLKFQICESFTLIPETIQNLKFTITYPDGSEKTINKGEGFELSEAGSYSILGIDQDPNSTLCNKTIEFSTSLFKPFTYRPVLSMDGCYDPILYLAQIEGLNYNEVSIRWLNSNGDVVGRLPYFYPLGAETYSLSVQPLKSGSCQDHTVSFTVKPNITSIDMELNTTSLCPDPGSATLTIEVDTEITKFIQWIFYDTSNQRQVLDEFENQFIIQVNKEGSYEAVAYNNNRCEVARELKLVEKSSFSSYPNIDTSYAICSIENTITDINPGEFEYYEWYLGDQLVSRNPTFKPEKLGFYRLVDIAVRFVPPVSV